MKRVAVFGGSFSPVHQGHLNVASGILNENLADEVWMMPCRLNPLKDGTTLMDDGIRLPMLEKAVRYQNRLDGNERIKINLLELDMPLPSYTIDTLRELSRRYPYQFRLVVGGDSYLEFERWKDWESIEKDFAPILYPRPGYEVKDVRKSWTLLSGVEETDISSTSIRRMMKEGDADLKKIMPWLN